MALDDKAKREFIEGIVEDFKRELEGNKDSNKLDNKTKKEIIDGNRKWATGLCERIVKLVQNGEVTFNLDGTGTQTKKVK
jgi:hypothetical protein